MKTSVTIVGLNFYPEDTAIGKYTTELAVYLSNTGYQVEIVTGFPYYPKWEIFQEYKSKPIWFKEQLEDIKLLRFKQYVPRKPNFSNRILQIISFTLGSFINLFKISKPDIVICIVPFTSTIILGWFLKIRYGSKLWIHIQDFEFDAASESGLIKSGSLLLKIINKIERFLYQKADVCSTISENMLLKLKSKYKKANYLFTNWIDVKSFTTKEEPHPFLKSNKFKILYSGNLGGKQDWNTLLSLVECFEEINEIEFIIVGEGPAKKNLEYHLSNYPFVSFYDLVPLEDLSSLLKSADAHFLFQKNTIIDTVLPSKLLGMMASGKPSIVTGNEQSEVKSIIENSGGGFYYNNSDVQRIRETIIYLKNNPLESQMIGEKAKKYLISHYSKDNILKKFSIKLEEIL